ncbi:hypothetical protein M7I_4644 [Glarea lozoyensis 74030]|uniref:Inosine/uridine-preferring nucleoside hydrolase domain-containing protein n=1 Tax=Glarea lozoyensis (strain ATCC 74030 / MF5533) TaxID=1104152 RepID=H0EPQ8_GLAL7|nr:hypothetical protein M7I_4644 [Glarea lozoyensis 74030]
MAAPLNRIIIDTDPGVDDILAILLALAAKPEELEILLLSVTYGNVEADKCLKNVITLFHIIEKEIEWRKSRGQLEGFGAMLSSKPLVAVGATHPLEDEMLMADYFHGIDGLAGTHTSHPHLTPADAWKHLFEGESEESIVSSKSFRASKAPAHQEILRLLRENPPDTITIVAVGPLTNLALAAAEDPETFLKVKEVCVMGGAIDVEGNITPVAEFNTYADAVATARVFALTSPTPSSTMPPPPLKMSTQWTSVFVLKTLEKIESLTRKQENPGLELHDPLCIWYMLTRNAPQWMLAPKAPEDIRVETAGQWTRGMHVVDRRQRKKAGRPEEQVKSPGAVDIVNPMESLNVTVSDQGMDVGEETHADPPGDNGSWLQYNRGNRINRMISSPGEDAFGPYIIERLFG